MRKESFKYVESTIVFHEENKKIVRKLEEDIIFNTLFTYNIDDIPKKQGGIRSSNVETSVDRMCANRKMERLKEEIKAVDELMANSSEIERQLIHKRYKEKKEWEIIKDELYISRRSAFRIRKHVIEKLGETLGII